MSSHVQTYEKLVARSSSTSDINHHELSPEPKDLAKLVTNMKYSFRLCILFLDKMVLEIKVLPVWHIISCF